MWRDEPADPHASVVASDSHGATIAASLVSTAPGAVYISDVFTHPDWQGRGAATACVAESRRPIPARDVMLPVVARITDGNILFERLFERAGSQRTGPL